MNHLSSFALLAEASPSPGNLALLGAGAFGAIIGWFVYFLNRYRAGEVQFSDLTTLIGIIGGAAILTLFGDGGTGAKGSGPLFGAYGVGLFVGFFGYFLTLIILVRKSGGKFSWTWFLDGRRKKLDQDEDIQGTRSTAAPMLTNDTSRTGQFPSSSLAIGEETPSTGIAFAPNFIDPTAARIITMCEAKWDANKGDCNAFVLAVSNALGIGGLSAPADAITSTITSNPQWRVLADGAEAKQAADAGELVIAGLRGSEHNPARVHGHVAIVVSGGLANGKYPTGYWGALGGPPYKNKTLNFAWNAADRDSVHYAAITVS